MTEPRGPARDSSRQDRKAPGNCLLRTPQPRPGNVMRGGAGRYFGATWAHPRPGPEPPLRRPYGPALAAIKQSIALAAAHLLRLTQPWRRNYSFILIAA